MTDMRSPTEDRPERQRPESDHSNEGQAMPQPILAPVGGDVIALQPQDQKKPFSWTKAISLLLSLLVIAASIYSLRDIDPRAILGMLPVSPAFWLLFALGFMAGPLAEFYIFHRIWGVGLPALGALTRKLIYNELLLGYLGEAWFYAWARKNSEIKTAPFGAVKDVAVLSAMSGNLMTLVLMAVAAPFLGMLDLGAHTDAVAWSLAFVVGTSLIIMLWRKSLFSLTRSELNMVFWVHMGRIVVTTSISGLLWAIVLPNTPIGYWLLLAAIRLLISRLPFVPNKDIVFAGVAALTVGPELQIDELLAMMAGLILAANLIVGSGLALYDLLKGVTRNDAID